ncbi:MAG: hypothetical protein GY737_02245, partial [Desulfobacteraceae bacterium]|nr:hypothetical protein [Desulfobacteraceae bacterium]
MALEGSLGSQKHNVRLHNFYARSGGSNYKLAFNKLAETIGNTDDEHFDKPNRIFILAGDFNTAEHRIDRAGAVHDYDYYYKTMKRRADTRNPAFFYRCVLPSKQLEDPFRREEFRHPTSSLQSRSRANYSRIDRVYMPRRFLEKADDGWRLKKHSMRYVEAESWLSDHSILEFELVNVVAGASPPATMEEAAHAR